MSRSRLLFSLCILLCCCPSVSLSAQEKVAPDWESINRRGYPQWFSDAKLGIFIHWGLYSVPAYASPEGYGEWFYRGLMVQDSGRTAVMRLFSDTSLSPVEQYRQLPNHWHAELWNPDQWAQMFRQSGARYVVLVTKHHDGYCLWDSPQQPEWNSVVSGPRRNIVEELSQSVRREGLRMGFYYSLPEWTNPLHIWMEDPSDSIGRYVSEYMEPQFRDLVDRYRPDLIFSDGDWNNSSEQLHSQQLISYYYNTVGSDAIVNNRWGSGTRHGFLTPEYSAGIRPSNVPWAECRGFGRSFGFNRNEQLENILSSDELIRHFVELVANGGGLTLNVGPNADGTIPFIQQDRLRSLGQWLAVNGEAIYCSRPFQLKGGSYLTQQTRREVVPMPAEQTICHDWVRNAPVSNGRTDHFTVRWTGCPDVRQSGNYTIMAEADDEVVVVLDGDTLLNYCKDNPNRQLQQTTLYLEAGRSYAMQVDFAEKDLEASLCLRWYRHGESETPVPIPARNGWNWTYSYDRTLRCFTSRPDSNAVYIIEFERPSQQVVVEGFPLLDRKCDITLLGCDQPLPWHQNRKGRLSIDLSSVDSRQLNALDHAWCFKVRF